MTNAEAVALLDDLAKRIQAIADQEQEPMCVCWKDGRPLLQPVRLRAYRYAEHGVIERIRYPRERVR